MKTPIGNDVCGSLVKNQTQAVAYGIPGNWIGRAPENGGNAVEPMVDVAPCQTVTDQHAVAYSIMPMNSGKDYKAREVEVAQPLMAGGPVGGNQGGDIIQQAMQVRRLTPVECERLQGFPDGYTDIQPKGKPTPDGPRYKALGNSMAVPCMKWIGKRIQMVEDL